MQTAWLDVGYIFCLLVLLPLCLYKRRRTRAPYPPGPKPLPIIENALDIPATHQWLRFAEWMKEHGSDVVSVSAFGKRLVILGSTEAVNDLFDKRSANYASRVRMPMIRELMGYTWSFPFMPYSDAWKHQRQIFQHYFLQRNISRYHPILTRSTHSLLRNLLEAPQDYANQISQSFADTIFDLVYGLSITGPNDPILVTAENMNHSISQAGVPGAFWVDFLPFLKYIPSWFPGAKFKRTAEQWRKIQEDFLNVPWDIAKQNLASGTARPCIATDLMEKLQLNSSGAEELCARAVSAVAYAGGRDTTVASSLYALAALCIHPEVQIRAQKELDRVIGSGRLPAFSDRSRLPYINAMVKGQPVFQLQPQTLLTSHSFRVESMAPDSPMWSILHDAEQYPDPEAFKPERWLMKDKDIEGGYRLNPDVPDPTCSFGFGRRICPGRFLSDHSIFLFLSTFLHAFTITPPLDENGKPGKMTQNDLKINASMITCPEPFGCNILPRSRATVRLVKETGLNG
ncbi:hypothetical protein VKT23_011692 [Stygiomarasmius scandens]|uniref:Cytochrome P450 n=1 Tax=Marasmiellus scandens TaxID=2682957 RepID=A0ABR1JAG1_9AGAR